MLDNAESEMEADLLIYSTARLESIRVETYLAIVRTLYYDYYLPWKSYLSQTDPQYEKHLDRIYATIQARLGRTLVVPVNGHKTLLANAPRSPLVTIHRIVSFSFQAVIVVVLLTAAMLGLKLAFHLSNASFAIVYGLAAWV